MTNVSFLLNLRAADDAGPAGPTGPAGTTGSTGATGPTGPAGTSEVLLDLNLVGRYSSSVFDEGAAEIVAYDPAAKRPFVVNSSAVTVDVLNLSDPANPVLLGTIDAKAEGGSANSVAVRNGVGAVAIEAPVKTDPGKVVFYDTTTLARISAVTVGALPDMLTFTPDGTAVLVANEGEPNVGYTIDPEGSISEIDVRNGFTAPTVTTGFGAFNADAAALRAAGVRIYGPNATVAQDLEPEYIAVAPRASASGTGPCLACTSPMPLPPTRSTARPIVTANEGDDRNDFIPGQETARVSALTLDPVVFPNAAELQAEGALGGRSFSIWADDGTQLFDSGSQFEQITARRYTAHFNASHDNNSLEDRSDNKGPKPEGVVLGQLAGRTFAFIGLERIGGIMVYDVTNPQNARFVQYVNSRDFSKDPESELPLVGDLGPEGLAFVPAEDSPNGKPLLIVGNEVSGTTAVYRVDTVVLQ